MMTIPMISPSTLTHTHKHWSKVDAQKTAFQATEPVSTFAFQNRNQRRRTVDCNLENNARVSRAVPVVPSALPPSPLSKWTPRVDKSMLIGMQWFRSLVKPRFDLYGKGGKEEKSESNRHVDAPHTH